MLAAKKFGVVPTNPGAMKIVRIVPLASSRPWMNSDDYIGKEKAEYRAKRLRKIDGAKAKQLLIDGREDHIMSGMLAAKIKSAADAIEVLEAGTRQYAQMVLVNFLIRKLGKEELSSAAYGLFKDNVLTSAEARCTLLQELNRPAMIRLLNDAHARLSEFEVAYLEESSGTPKRSEWLPVNKIIFGMHENRSEGKT